MSTKSILALIALACAFVALAPPADARHYRDGWRHYRHHYAWYRHGYRPAVSDYYHRSRQLVGTR